MPSNYDVTPTDFGAGSALAAYGVGQHQAQGLANNFLQHQVGATAATQGLLPASQAAMMGGDVQQGIDIQNMAIDRQMKLFDIMGRGAMAADTPEKWNQFSNVIEQNFGQGSMGPFRDFNSRQNAVYMALSARDQLQNRIQQEQIQENRYQPSTLPSGNQLVFDKLTGTSRLITPEEAEQAGSQGGDVAAGQGIPGTSNSMLNTQFGAGTARQATAALVSNSQKAYDAAQSGNLQMDLLEKALNKVPQSGFLTPGATESFRAKVANEVNTLGTGAGVGKMFDPETVAALEQANKITTRLGYETAKMLGTREAAQIVQQSISIQPGQELTLAGRKRIIAGVRAANQREIDYHNFLADPKTGWLRSHSGDASGSDIAFDKLHPVSDYVAQAEKEAPLDQGTQAAAPVTSGTTSTGVKWSISP